MLMGGEFICVTKLYGPAPAIASLAIPAGPVDHTEAAPVLFGNIIIYPPDRSNKSHFYRKDANFTSDVSQYLWRCTKK